MTFSEKLFRERCRVLQSGCRQELRRAGRRASGRNPGKEAPRAARRDARIIKALCRALCVKTRANTDRMSIVEGLDRTCGGKSTVMFLQSALMSAG